MTVPTYRSREDYTGNGVTTSYPYQFRIYEATDLVVTHATPEGVETELVLNTDYTVSGVGKYAGGNVVLASALASGYRLTIERALPVTQETDLRNQGAYFAETHEDVFDRMAMLLQRIGSYLGLGPDGALRTLLLGKTDIDGQGAFRARQNRIQDLADPVNDQDAANKRWSIDTLRQWQDDSGAALRYDLASSDPAKGAAMIGFKRSGIAGAVASTLASEISAMAIDAQVTFSVKTGLTGYDVAANTVAMQKAIDASVYFPVRFRAGIYRHSATLIIPEGAQIYCDGVGQWVPLSLVPCDSNGTIWLAEGSGPKIHTLPGVTDNRTAGGVVANPTPLNAPLDSNYSLLSFHNSDANGTTGVAATEKLFSCAVKTVRGARHIRMSNLRIVPSFNGMQGYIDRTNALADDWDIGLWMDNADQCYLENVYVVGYWRMVGKLQTASTNDSALAGVDAGAEWNVYDRCMFQGFRGVSIRAADLHKITAVGSDWIEMPWADNHPFSVGSFRAGNNQYSTTPYTFTGVAKSGGNLRLTGVSPTPASLSVSTGVVVPNLYAAGTSQTTYQNCKIHGFDHFAGVLGTSFGLAPSSALEISGWALSGIKFPGTKLQTQEDVLIHAHNVVQPYFGPAMHIECINAMTGASLGSRVITSPTPSSNTRVTTPTGETLNAMFDIAQDTGADLSPLWSAQSTSRFAGQPGLLSLSNYRFTHYAGIKRAGKWDSATNTITYGGGNTTNFTDGGDVTRLSLTASANTYRAPAHFFRDATGVTNCLRVDASTLEVRYYGGQVPNSDNSYDYGTASLRGRTAYFGTGTINTSDGREKTEPLPIDDAVLDAWGDLQLIAFQWLDAIRQKGADVARWHFGVIAQQVRDAFTAHGLDGTRYGLLCYDEWDDVYEPVMGVRDNLETGKQEEYDTGEVVLTLAAGNRWGIRPDQCLFLEAAYQRRRMSRLEARLAALENTH